MSGDVSAKTAAPLLPKAAIVEDDASEQRMGDVEIPEIPDLDTNFDIKVVTLIRVQFCSSFGRTLD